MTAQEEWDSIMTMLLDVLDQLVVCDHTYAWRGCGDTPATHVCTKCGHEIVREYDYKKRRYEL